MARPRRWAVIVRVSVESQTMQDRILDAAEQIANAVGIRKLRVDQVATDAGVSRQSVYNAFGDKAGLAQALCVRSFARVLDGCEPVVVACGSDPTDALAEAVRHVLLDAMRRPLLRLALRGDEERSVVPLLAVQAGPLVVYVRERIHGLVAALWPRLGGDRVELVAELVTRLMLINLICPTESPDDAVRTMAGIVRTVMAAPD
ncbi:TetR family transcriptional regulator [Actinokineospora alba]|nr:TetR family transcriptional regulator [Actinokineospora alba]